MVPGESVYSTSVLCSFFLLLSNVAGSTATLINWVGELKLAWTNTATALSAHLGVQPNMLLLNLIQLI